MVNFHGLGMPSFEYNGVNVTNTYGIRMTAKPSIPTPQQRAEKFTVGGRDSFLTYTDGTYENITITVPVRIRVLESEVQSKFQEIRDLFMKRNYFQDGAELIFSLYPDWKYEVYEWHPYTWEYFPSTGEWFTTFEIECRPYKKSTTTDTIIIDNVGDLQMSPWMNFRAQDRDQFGKSYYEAGAYEVFDGSGIQMMENYGLIDGAQNMDALVPRLQATDGSGIPYKVYNTATNREIRNCLNSFYDNTSDSFNVIGQWKWDPTVSPYSGHHLYCNPHAGLSRAWTQMSPYDMKRYTDGNNYMNYYINYKTSNPSQVSVSLYEVDPTGKRIKTLVASGKNGASFAFMNMTNFSDNFVQIAVEFTNPSVINDISELRISRTNEAPYAPTFNSYSTSHVKANIIEMAKTLDMFVFNNSDTPTAKLTAIQGRAPEIEVHHVSTLPSGYDVLSHEITQVVKPVSGRHQQYSLRNGTTAGSYNVVSNPLKPSSTTTITLSGATSTDSKLHYLSVTQLEENKTAGVPQPMTVLLDEFYVRMRMNVRPTTSRVYDNNGGEEAPMMITVTPRGGQAVLEWRNAAGGIFEKFTLGLPPEQMNADIIIDTDRKLVYNVATGVPLTQYCFGTFPRCFKGQRMEYRINGDILKARIEITKRKL